MDPPGGRRRQGRPPKVTGSESPTSPGDDDLSTEVNSGGASTECRRSSRKKTIKFDVRDLLNKNRKSHKIQIEARIDSNAPKVGIGPASKEELDNKQKNFIEKSAIFRRYSISENKIPPRPPPPPVALIQSIQQCVGELEQMPLDGGIDLASISPLARRISRTQEILTASMMKPKQVSSLIVTKLECGMTTRATPVDKAKVENLKLSDEPKVKVPPKRRGRPPKIIESSESTTESSNESFKTRKVKGKQLNKPRKCISPPRTKCNAEEGPCVSNGRESSVSPDSSTKGIDLKEMLDASAVTLPQPTILDDCMLVSNDDLFVAAEEEVFAESLSSDDSVGFSQNSPMPKKSEEIPLFTRSNSTETNSSDDSERKRKVKVSVKRISLSSPIKERVPETGSSDEKSDAIEILSSNDEERSKIPGRPVTTLPQPLENKYKSPRSKSARGIPKKNQCVVEDEQSTSHTPSSETDSSSDSATLTEDHPPTKTLRMTRARRAKSCKRHDGERTNIGKDEEQMIVKIVEVSSQKGTRMTQKLESKQEQKKEGPGSSEEISGSKNESSRRRRVTPQKENEVITQLSLRSRKDHKPHDEQTITTKQREESSPVKKHQPEALEVSTADEQSGPASDNQTLNVTDSQVDDGSEEEKTQTDASHLDAELSESERKDSHPKAASPTPSTARAKTQKQTNDDHVQRSNSNETNYSHVTPVIADSSSSSAEEFKCQGGPSTPSNAKMPIETENIRNKISSDQTSDASSSSSTTTQPSLRSQDNFEETALSSPYEKSKKEKATQDPASSARRTRVLRKHNKEFIKCENITDEIKSRPETLPKNNVQSELTELNSPKRSDKSAEDSLQEQSAPSALTGENVPKNEKKPSKAAKKLVAELFSPQTSDSTDQNSTDTSNSTSSGRRESLRAALIASLSMTQNTTITEATSNDGDHGSSSSESSVQSHTKIRKNRRQTQVKLSDKSKEDTSSVCSESSSTTSSSSSSSSTSATTSLSATSSSSSQCRATRSKKELDTSQDESLKKGPTNKLRSTPPRRAKSVSNSTKSEATTIRKSDSESSESSKKQIATEILRKWVSAYDEENNETGSESSETSPLTRQTRSGRSRVRASVAQTTEPPTQTSEETKFEAKATSYDTVKDKIISKKFAKLRQTSLDERSSSDAGTPPQTPTRPKDLNDKLSTDGETTPSKVAIPRSKSRRRTRKFVPLKDSSTESNNVSEDDTSSNGNSSPGTRMMRNTRARRKTISSSSELADLFIENLSPPDKPLEYLLCRSRKPSSWLEENEPARHLSPDKSTTGTEMQIANDSKMENVESDMSKEEVVVSTPDKSTRPNTAEESKPGDVKMFVSEKNKVLSTESQTNSLQNPADDNSKAESSENLKTSKQTDEKSFTATMSDDQPKISDPRKRSKSLRKTRSNLHIEAEIEEQKKNIESGSDTELNTDEPKRIEKNKVYVSIIELSGGVTPDDSIKFSRAKKCSKARILKTTANDNEAKHSVAIDPDKGKDKSEVSSSSVPVATISEKSEETVMTDQTTASKETPMLNEGSSISTPNDEGDIGADVEKIDALESVSIIATQDDKPHVEAASISSNDFATEKEDEAIESVLRLNAVHNPEQLSTQSASSPASIVSDKIDSVTEVTENNVQTLVGSPKDEIAATPKLDSNLLPTAKTESTAEQQTPTKNEMESFPISIPLLPSESTEAKAAVQDSTTLEVENELVLPPRVENISTEKPKKEPSPRKKKKGVQQHQEPLKAVKELDFKINSSESNHSDDSVKTDTTTKPESKMTPRRQLDSSFIESLEKSLLRPISSKKSSKQKDKESALMTTLIGKEESKKLKKLLESHDLPKKLEINSPKSKKKLKDGVKIDKKPEEESSSKRKSSIKAKAFETEAPKLISNPPDDSKTKSSASVSSPEPTSIQVAEIAETLPRPLKSKAETKFYPSDQPNQEKLASVVEKLAVSLVEKEKSPDLIPDPLKDIEKFIEDGVNLLKRGYKLDDEDDAALDRNILKSDDMMTPKKCKLDDSSNEKKDSPREDDNSNSNSNSECSTLATTPTSDVDTPNGIRRSHRIKNNTKSSKCLVGRGLVRDKERFSTKDDEKTIYSIDDQKMDLAEVEAKNSKFLKDMEERLSNFRVIRENEYKCERVISKEAKRMLCDCFLTPEEEDRGELGCGEDCLNRLLMIECGSDCTVRDRCTNRRFTKFLYSPCRVFRTEKKGFGIMADIEILPGEFIMEYVGEVINGDEFENRRNAYSQDKNKHYYFMALRSDAVIDATAKGNISRFINHSCDPNAETQKWTVNGELRIGFFSRKNIMPGEEITFDYQYQRYGKEAQKCYCESSNCRGWIGEEPSSEEEELDEDEEEESEGTEDEPEEQQVVPKPVLPPILIDQQLVPVALEVSPITEIKPVTGPEIVPPIAVPVTTPVVIPMKPHADVKITKKKKEKKRFLERKEDKIKRRENKQFLEDPDIEDEVRFLEKCGLKNQADTLRLSRLIVRAKLLETRLKLLLILRKGELPCRRLFLDYHGLRLLHGWMSDVIDTRDTEKSMEIRMVLLSVLECLPISNKTMLTDSKVYQTVRDWSNNKESHSPCDGSPKDSTTLLPPTPSPAGPDDSSAELQKLSAKLVNTWDNLPEVFRIPKRERIEQMKEHEREADMQYKGLREEDSRTEVSRNNERFMRNTVSNSARFKWSRSEKDKDRDRTAERRKFAQNLNAAKDGTEIDSHLSKEQRRELFAAKVARDEAEKRLAEERREFDIKCRFFGLDPKRLRPENMPFCVNPSTGQWYSTDKKPIATPPSYAHVQVPVKPKSTNPSDYRLPLMDLPPLWKFAISPKGKIYYYHVKIRIPQWEPPIKILPLAGQNNPQVKTSESDSSNAEGIDSSEDDIEAIKGLDPVKLQAYIEKKIEDRRLQRYTRLVEEKSISPRKEEDRIYNQMEVRKYKENKEKIRKRKEEIRRRRDSVVLATSVDLNSTGSLESDDKPLDAVPIQDYLLSSDEENMIKAECNNSPLIDKIVQGDKIVDELDALQCKRPLKRPLPIREKYEHKKRKMEKQIKDAIKSTKRNKDAESSSSSKYRKIREKFRCEIAGIIVHYLKPYRKDTCPSGRILTDDDFNHLARKLTHFVMVKELKYCESIGQTLVVTESVKNKSREFIKKYMAKYGGIYVRPKNDPEFKEIPFL